jgi:hypothetical protein
LTPPAKLDHGEVEWILLLLAIVAPGFVAWLWSNCSRLRPPNASALSPPLLVKQ